MTHGLITTQNRNQQQPNNIIDVIEVQHD